MTPKGALTEEQRLELNRKSRDSAYKWTGKRGYYVVRRDTCELVIGGTPAIQTLDGSHSFSFDWRPDSAYYFTNYFYALAYFLRLKAQLEEEIKCSK